MFDFIYYIVSFILWCWHQVFGFILGPSNFIGWALSIILLVFTLRLVLLKPAVHQIRSMRKMQKFAPEMKKIQKKYANDRQRQAQEMQKLQREHGVNPLGGCLPMVLQIPVFLGLNHVLRSFRPGTSEVYFFKAGDVHSYLDAKLFDAHLGDAVLGVGSLGGSPGWHWGVAPVAIPLMIAAAIATHFTARLSVQRQAALGTPATGQTAMMNKLTLYIFPLGVLIFGGGFPVGLLLYWLSNNGWTLAQQHFVFKRMDREDEVQKEQAVQTRQALAPKPGQKPVVKRRNATPAKPVEDAIPEGFEDAATDVDTGTDATPIEDAVPAQDAKPKRAANDPRRPVKPTVPNPNAKKPAPGARPNARNARAGGSAATGGTGAAAKNGTSSKTAATAKNTPARDTAAKNTAAKNTAAKNTAAKANARTNGAAAKQDGTTAQPTNGKTGASSEIPGLISDRSRRKKRDRKSG